jgi:hypothetical protein
MKKMIATLATEEELLVDLTFHSVPASLLTEFSEKIVKPYFRGNMNAAVQDLLQKALAEQDFVLSHITHVRSFLEAKLGKTVESYRMALEEEIHRWDGFERALRKPDREAFEELMDMSRIGAKAAGNACNPILFESMIMSILSGIQKMIINLEKKMEGRA